MSVATLPFPPPDPTASASTPRVALRRALVWRAKLAAKVAMAYLPVSRERWRRLGAFKLGYMTDPAYALATFEKNVSRAHHAPAERGDGTRPVFDPGAPDGSAPPDVRGLRLLELGPGEVLSSAVVARAAGAAAMTLIDAGDFTLPTVDRYREIARLGSARFGGPVDLDGVTDVPGVLARCGAQLLTDGLASLRSLPTATVDVVWSHTMLEHVRADELPDLLRELRRVLAPGGVASHQVDLQDHLDYSLNNLRFSERAWESPVIARSECYTNRVGYAELLTMFDAAGFAVEVVRVDRWRAVPTPRRHLAPRFRTRTDDDLRVRVFDVLLRPAS